MKKHVVILGGGISGLSAAWFLKKKYADAIDITLLEQSNRTGGWIRSIKEEGFLFELGPHSCRPRGTGIKTLELIESLGLQDQVIPANANSKKRFLYIDQALRPVPTNPFACLTSPVTKGLIPALWKDLWAKKQSHFDETIYDFTQRRFGRSIAERLIDPLTSGIYAGDIKQLSIRSCFPKLYELEQEYGSVIKGMFRKKEKPQQHSLFVARMATHPMISFINGMETLPRALADALTDHIRLSCPVQSLHFNAHKVEVVCNNTALQADHVISALPAHQLGRLINAHNHEFANQCTSIPHVSLAMVSIGFRTSVLSQEGFGYLVPQKERSEILGMIWDSCVFPQQNNDSEETRVTVMIGGAHLPQVEQLEDQECIAIALRALSKHLGITHYPSAVYVHRAHQAIPQYQYGHHQKLAKIALESARTSSRLSYLGNAFHGVSINDCVAQAEQLSHSLGNLL